MGGAGGNGSCKWAVTEGLPAGAKTAAALLCTRNVAAEGSPVDRDAAAVGTETDTGAVTSVGERGDTEDDDDDGSSRLAGAAAELRATS